MEPFFHVAGTQTCRCLAPRPTLYFPPLKRFSWQSAFSTSTRSSSTLSRLRSAALRGRKAPCHGPFDTIEMEICGSSGIKGAESHFGADETELASPPDSLLFQALWRSGAWQLDRLCWYLAPRRALLHHGLGRDRSAALQGLTSARARPRCAHGVFRVISSLKPEFTRPFMPGSLE